MHILGAEFPNESGDMASVDEACGDADTVIEEMVREDGRGMEWRPCLLPMVAPEPEPADTAGSARTRIIMPALLYGAGG
jgi:hypothetical protein